MRICTPGDLNPSESVRQEGDVPTCYPIAPDIACTLTHFHSLEIPLGRTTQSDGCQVLGRDLRPAGTTGCPLSPPGMDAILPLLLASPLPFASLSSSLFQYSSSIISASSMILRSFIVLRCREKFGGPSSCEITANRTLNIRRRVIINWRPPTGTDSLESGESQNERGYGRKSVTRGLVNNLFQEVI